MNYPKSNHLLKATGNGERGTVKAYGGEFKPATNADHFLSGGLYPVQGEFRQE
ncbi:MAG TPA: hypothetical protein V6D50_24485 [Chroococcales cyanobacterium]